MLFLKIRCCFLKLFLISRKLEGRKYSLSRDGSTLVIQNLSENDAGVYECVAENNIGETRSFAHLRINNQNCIEQMLFTQICL